MVVKIPSNNDKDKTHKVTAFSDAAGEKIVVKKCDIQLVRTESPQISIQAQNQLVEAL